MRFFFLALLSDDDDSDESDEDGSGSRFTSGSCFFPRFELSTDHVILFLSGRVPIFWFDVSRSNTSLVSNSESLIYLRNANFSLIVSISPCVGAILTSLYVGLKIQSWSTILVAPMESIGWPTLSVCMGGCLKDTIFWVWTSREFARFVRSLKFDSLIILGQIFSRLASSIHKDVIFLSSVEDRWTAVSSLFDSPTSLWTLKLSSLLQIYLFTNGFPILPRSGLLSPTSLDAHTSLSLVRKGSVRGAITSV